MTNSSVYPNTVGDVSRRAKSALNNRIYALTSQVENIVGKTLKESGL
jgi:hypothetical protein